MMLDTRVIFIEGIPGSGKSTTAQFLAWHLQRAGIPAVWWYEEMRDHRLFVFHDLQTLQETVDKLFSGRHQEVVEAALARWRAFAEEHARGDAVAVFDSCLFGYMTWGLFPADVPWGEIEAYVAEVERIIAPLNPAVIYLSQQDIGRALRRIIERRGRDTEEFLVGRTTGNPYGKRLGLQGFEGLIRHWTDFRALTDGLFARCPFEKLAIENSAGDWRAYEARMLDFLGLPQLADDEPPPAGLHRFAGIYARIGQEDGEDCRVELAADGLLLEGLDIVWTRSRLLPRGGARFAVQSLPFEVTFEEADSGGVTGLRLAGPGMLHGPVDRRYARIPDRR